jgi:hypothetical protein
MPLWSLKTTWYFQDQVLPKRPYLTESLLRRAIETAEVRHVQSDGRVRLWARLDEVQGRWLRVVLLSDRETVHNAFLDRDGPPSLESTEDQK